MQKALKSRGFSGVLTLTSACLCHFVFPGITRATFSLRLQRKTTLLREMGKCLETWERLCLYLNAGTAPEAQCCHHTECSDLLGLLWEDVPPWPSTGRATSISWLEGRCPVPSSPGRRRLPVPGWESRGPPWHSWCHSLSRHQRGLWLGFLG